MKLRSDSYSSSFKRTQKKHLAELDEFWEELKSATTTHIDQQDNLPIPTNVKRLAMTKATLALVQECINSVNTHKLLTYGCWKLCHQVDKEKKETPCFFNIYLYYQTLKK